MENSKIKYIAHVFRNDGGWHSGEYNHEPLIYFEAENIEEANKIMDELKRKEDDIEKVYWIKTYDELKKEFMESIERMGTDYEDIMHLAKAFVEVEKNEKGYYHSTIYKHPYSDYFSSKKGNILFEDSTNLYYDF